MPLRRSSWLQGALIQSLNLQPVQAGGNGQADVLGDNAFGDAKRGGDAFVRELGVELQTQNVLDLAHSDPSGIGHAGSSKGWEATRMGGTNMRNASRCRSMPFRHRDRDSGVVTDIPVKARNRSR